MASRLFARGPMYGDIQLYECTVGGFDFSTTKAQNEQFISDLYDYLYDRLDELDDRLWWQSETSEIFYEDVDQEKPLPDESDFESWWSEQIDNFLEEYRLKE